MKSLFLAAVCLGVTAAPGQTVFPGGLENMSVQIVAGPSQGSGVFLEHSNRVFLVTAKHVLFDLEKTNCPLFSTHAQVFYHSPDCETESELRIDLEKSDATRLLRRHPTRDVAAVFIRRQATNDDSRISIFIERTSTNRTPVFGGDLIQKFKDVAIGGDVYGFGYPTSLGIPETPQLNPRRALARKGIVADKDPQRRKLVLDMPVYKGNSGGPIVQRIQTGIAEYQFGIIGISVEFIPFRELWINDKFRYANTTYSNSGYSIAEPMDTVLELLWTDTP